jgi:hypothetical protein
MDTGKYFGGGGGGACTTGELDGFILVGDSVARNVKARSCRGCTGFNAPELKHPGGWRAGAAAFGLKPGQRAAIMTTISINYNNLIIPLGT